MVGGGYASDERRSGYCAKGEHDPSRTYERGRVDRTAGRKMVEKMAGCRLKSCG